MQSVATPRAPLSRLESLPGELLDIVFYHTWSKEPQVANPVSPALKPYFQRNLYRSIQVDYPHFLRLCTHSLHHASLVKSLKIEGASGATAYYQLEHEDTIYNFFKSATSLKSLAISSSYPSLQYRIVSPKFAVGCFDQLEALDISVPLIPHFPDDPRYLSCFARLRHVAVGMSDTRLNVEHGKLDSFEQQDEDALKLFGGGTEGTGLELNIESLSLRKPHRRLVMLTKRCRSLKKLEALINCSEWSQAQLASVLDALPSPSLLTSLLIDVAGGGWVTGGIEVSITRFVNLEHLKIFKYLVMTALIASLAKLSKIKSIEFGNSGPPSYTHVLTLLHPATRPPTLRSPLFPPPIHVEGENVFGLEGYFKEVGRLGPMKLQWYDPGMTLDNARDVVVKAAVEKVELSKGFSRAIKLTDSYEEDIGRWNSQRRERKQVAE